MDEIAIKRQEKKEISQTQERLDLGIKALEDIDGFYQQIEILADFSGDPDNKFKQIIIRILNDVIKYCSDKNGVKYLKSVKNNYILILIALENNPTFPKDLSLLRLRAISELQKLK